MKILFYIYTILDFFIIFILSAIISGGNGTFVDLFGKNIGTNYYDGDLEDKLTNTILSALFTEIISFTLLAVLGEDIYFLFKIFFISIKVAYSIFLVYFIRYLIGYLRDRSKDKFDEEQFKKDLNEIFNDCKIIQEELNRLKIRKDMYNEED